MHFYNKVKNSFEYRKSTTEKAIADLEIEAKYANREAARLADLWIDALIDAARDESLRPIADRLDIQSQAFDTRFNKIVNQIQTLKQSLIQDPITKLYSHCILVANDKANLSRLYNTDWGKYFAKN